MIPHVSRAVVAAAMAFACASLHAQGPGLKLDRRGASRDASEAPLPTFLSADRIEGLGEAEVEASGNVELRRGDTSLNADRLRYFQDTDEVEATGNVRARLGGDEMTGPRLRLRLNDSQGIFEQPSYRLAGRLRKLRTGTAGPGLTATEPAPQILVESRGDAKALRFNGPDRYLVTDGTFTTCKPGQDDWLFEARELDIDMDREVGTARRARMTLFGIPTPRIPWIDFALNNNRKTGFLLPIIGAQNRAGTQVALPFYWNIAPNYDATIVTRYMERRGTQFLNEFRFLEPWIVGEARYDILPKDQVAGGIRRYAASLNPVWNLQNGWSGAVNYQAVSDDNYFRDLSTQVSVATQTHLTQDATINYSWRDWSAGLRLQRFQTLQDPQSPVPEPYFREPQFMLRGARQAVRGFDLAFEGEFVDFTNPPLNSPSGRRTLVYPAVSRPFVTSYGFVTPKIGLHATQYNLRALGNLPDPSLSRTVPISSVESGLILERDTRWAGTDYQQTVEPRLYYLYVPFRDQSNFPVFDTGTSDFNFAQLFQENIFVGGDRIANANQLSVAATSRLLRATDGQEVLRAIIGQRYYFDEQRVVIEGQPVRTESVSPIILGLVGRVARNWTTEIGMQYRTTAGYSVEKLNTGVRYSPAPASVASVSYRYTAENLTAGAATINSVDFAAQWPLWRGLYGVGRYSFDIEGNKPVEELIGFEYNGGCWIIRAVAHRFQTATAQETTAFYAQLELNGFTRIGSNALELLRRNIPGYSQINRAPIGSPMLDFVPPATGTSSGRL